MSENSQWAARKLVAVKERKLSYYDKKTLLVTKYPYDSGYHNGYIVIDNVALSFVS